MRIKSCTIYALAIPFVEAFAHSAKSRRSSDSIVVRLEASDGGVGYGEGVARSFVTGETVESSLDHISEVLWPAAHARDYAELEPAPDPLRTLAQVDESLPVETRSGVIAFNAARAAVEIALLDCLLRRRNLSLAEILPPRRTSVTYGAVISSGSTESSVRRARQFKLFGLREVKIKIKDREDVSRVHAVREALGDSARLRVDANGAFDAATAIEVAAELSPIRLAAFEQPVARTRNASELKRVREQSSIPVMADESIVTMEDARSLIDAGACDYFNLRISKCGGIIRTLQLAQAAGRAGVRLQLGCHVGETAILSAAGRHMAAHLCEAEFVEGSYGRLLLSEDVSREPVQFGHGGLAPLLRGPGLGINVRPEVLERYARHRIHLGEREKIHA
jgi:L-alanine-DL-glutamate epimerase-like enolase superfamily enzyme